MTGRDDILRRFEEWLDTTLAQEEPPRGIPSEILDGVETAAGDPPADWYAMWAAVTALTQEVKLQGRAFKQMSETLAREADSRSRKEVLDALLDLRERMLRGVDSVRAIEDPRPAFWDRIFRRRWQRTQHFIEIVRALEKGYRLSLDSLDDLLDRYHVRPIECQGLAFDPRLMSAVDVEETGDAADGTVLSVYRTGYEWNGEVYRPAEVRVAQRPRNEAMYE